MHSERTCSIHTLSWMNRTGMRFIHPGHPIGQLARESCWGGGWCHHGDAAVPFAMCVARPETSSGAGFRHRLSNCSVTVRSNPAACKDPRCSWPRRHQPPKSTHQTERILSNSWSVRSTNTMQVVFERTDLVCLPFWMFGRMGRLMRLLCGRFARRMNVAWSSTLVDCIVWCCLGLMRTAELWIFKPVP